MFKHALVARKDTEYYKDYQKYMPFNDARRDINATIQGAINRGEFSCLVALVDLSTEFNEKLLKQLVEAGYEVRNTALGCYTISWENA